MRADGSPLNAMLYNLSGALINTVLDLHLCGQGDKTPRTNAQMHRREDKYLKFWEEQ